MALAVYIAERYKLLVCSSAYLDNAAQLSALSWHIHLVSSCLSAVDSAKENCIGLSHY